jgi:hypothetical protein
MFASIADCRAIVQKEIPKIQDKDQQDIAAGLLASVEAIERTREDPNFDKINQLKLNALRLFRQLAKSSGGSYALPNAGTLAEGFLFYEGRS